MDKKSVQDQFDFVFDAPNYSEFLPNKDINYYNPLENKINQNNELDAWFLTYHEDHYQTKQEIKKGKATKVTQVFEKKQFTTTRSKGELLPKARKRKQISSDEYQQQNQATQSQQLPEKKPTRIARRSVNTDVGKIGTDKDNTLSTDTTIRRRQSKDSSAVNSKPSQIIPILEKTQRVSTSSQSSQSQDKRITRSKSNSRNLLPSKQLDSMNKRLSQPDKQSQKMPNKKETKMIPEVVEEKQISSESQRIKSNKQPQKKSPELLRQGNESADRMNSQLNKKNDLEKKISVGNRNSQRMEECTSSISQSKRIQTNQKENKVELSSHYNNQNDYSNRYINNNYLKNDNPIINHASIFQNKSSQQVINKEVVAFQPLLSSINPQFSPPPPKDNIFTNSLLKTNQIEMNNQLASQIFTIKEFNIDDEIVQFITSPKPLLFQNIFEKQNVSTPVLKTLSNKNPNTNTRRSTDNRSVLKESVNLQPVVDFMNTQVQNNRMRINKSKMVNEEQSNNENKQPQNYQRQRHKSLNFSQKRKSCSLAENVKNKRRSEMPAYLVRSKSIEEQPSDSDRIKQFEREWEKKNGVKLYMLDYQKRKEIRQLCQESSKLV